MNKIVPSDNSFPKKKNFPPVSLTEKVQTIANSISSIASLIMIFFIALQTKSMNENIREIERGFNLESLEAIQEHKQRVNQILIEDNSGMAKSTFNLEKKDILGYIILNDYESLFNMRCEGLITDSSWEEIERMINNTMQGASMINFWKTNPKIGANFRKYVNNLTVGRGSNFNQEKSYCSQSR